MVFFQIDIDGLYAHYLILVSPSVAMYSLLLNGATVVPHTYWSSIPGESHHKVPIEQAHEALVLTHVITPFISHNLQLSVHSVHSKSNPWSPNILILVYCILIYQEALAFWNIRLSGEGKEEKVSQWRVNLTQIEMGNLSIQVAHSFLLLLTHCLPICTQGHFKIKILFTWTINLTHGTSLQDSMDAIFWQELSLSSNNL